MYGVNPKFCDTAPGGLVHFNCHIQDMAPLRPAGIELLVDKLLVGCDTKEDALAAAFCLLRCGLSETIRSL